MDRVQYDRGQTVGMAWEYFFGPAGFGPLPESLRFLPGGEFVITKSKILARPRQFYLDAISFLLEFSESGQMTSFELATVFELTWHIYFWRSGGSFHCTDQGLRIEPVSFAAFHSSSAN